MKPFKNIFLILVSIISFSVVTAFAQEQRENLVNYKTQIVVKNTKQKLNITGNFINNTGDSIAIQYLLVTKKTGDSGSTSSTQKGNVEVKGNEEKILSKVTLNIVKDDTYFIKLFTYSGNKEIGRDSVLYNMK